MRPTAYLMRDEAFGYPQAISGPQKATQGFAAHYPWTAWDFALDEAFETIEFYTDEYGLHAWEVADEAVEVAASRKINKFLSAKDRVTGKKNYKPIPGEYFVPVVKTRRDTGFWTFNEWLQAETDKIEADRTT